MNAHIVLIVGMSDTDRLSFEAHDRIQLLCCRGESKSCRRNGGHSIKRSKLLKMDQKRDAAIIVSPQRSAAAKTPPLSVYEMKIGSLLL